MARMKSPGKSANIVRAVRVEKCPAWDKECTKCTKLGHFAAKCHQRKEQVRPVASANSVGTVHKGTLCSVGLVEKKAEADMVTLVDRLGKKCK